AREVGTTEHLLKNRLRALYDKLGMWHRVELALWYRARGSDGRANACRRTGAGHFSLGAVNACEARGLRRNLDVPDESILMISVRPDPLSLRLRPENTCA